MNKYLKFLTFSIAILGGGRTALNNCYGMEEINPQASSSINSSIINNNNDINPININNNENILEKKIKLAEVKELVQSFSTNPSDNNFDLDLFQKEHEKQVDVINLLPQLLSKSIEQYNYNNCYMRDCNQNDLLNNLIQDWMGDIKHCNNNEEFIQKIIERFNNNYNNIKDYLEGLGIVINVNKIKNLDIINNN